MVRRGERGEEERGRRGGEGMASQVRRGEPGERFEEGRGRRGEESAVKREGRCDIARRGSG